jgi:hypothetical protein
MGGIMTEMTSIAQDFANAIQIEHLTDEQINIVADILKDFK